MDDKKVTDAAWTLLTSFIRLQEDEQYDRYGTKSTTRST